MANNPIEQGLTGILILSDPCENIVKNRVRVAVEYGHKLEKRVFLACGGRTPYLSSKYGSECKITEECLGGLGVSDNDIALERKSKDTRGNIFFSLEHFDGDSLTIVSNAKQLDRARKIIDRGKVQGVINPGLNVTYVPTHSTPGEVAYETVVKGPTRRQVASDLKPIEKYGFLSAVLKSVLIKTRDFINSFYFGPFWRV